MRLEIRDPRSETPRPRLETRGLCLHHGVGEARPGNCPDAEGAVLAARPPPPALAALGHPPALAVLGHPGARPHLRGAGSQAAPSRPRCARAPSPTSWWRGECGGFCLSHAVGEGVFERMLGRGGGCRQRAPGLMLWVLAPRRPPPALAALGHPPPLRGGGEVLGACVFDSASGHQARVVLNVRPL